MGVFFSTVVGIVSGMVGVHSSLEMRGFDAIAATLWKR